MDHDFFYSGTQTTHESHPDCITNAPHFFKPSRGFDKKKLQIEVVELQLLTKNKDLLLLLSEKTSIYERNLLKNLINKQPYTTLT